MAGIETGRQSWNVMLVNTIDDLKIHSTINTMLHLLKKLKVELRVESEDIKKLYFSTNLVGYMKN